MIRNCSLEDISDGKLYTENDMVKADTNNCAGCKSVCCHGMGDVKAVSILLRKHWQRNWRQAIFR